MFAVTIPESHRHDDVLAIMKVFWFSSALYVIANIAGFIAGSPFDRELKMELAWEGWTADAKLIVCYVSRGQNSDALGRAVFKTRFVLEELGVPYEIETVTDEPIAIPGCTSYVVPTEYQTVRGAKYKARALHYAAEQRTVGKNTWVLHMDEESVLSPYAVYGVHDFIVRGDMLRIGQGEIKYNSYQYGANPLITAIDAVRTGDDLGRFRLQYRLLKRPVFGMHGSFFVVHSAVEHKIGFDLGGKGSITEDAYFALIASSRGVKFEWVDGYVSEQSPFTILDLLKQRRRWIAGLRLLVMDTAIPFRQRWVMLASIVLCHFAWLSPIVTVWNVVSGGAYVPEQVAIAAALMSGIIYAVYLLGAYRNVVGINMPFKEQLKVWAMTGALVPISSLVESIAIIYSIVRPVKTFEVVSK
jgi:egghead protein (zeste-white 4 protein)